jgi:hypothetical protein
MSPLVDVLTNIQDSPDCATEHPERLQLKLELLGYLNVSLRKINSTDLEVLNGLIKSNKGTM